MCLQPESLVGGFNWCVKCLHNNFHLLGVFKYLLSRHGRARTVSAPSAKEASNRNFHTSHRRGPWLMPPESLPSFHNCLFYGTYNFDVCINCSPHSLLLFEYKMRINYADFCHLSLCRAHADYLEQISFYSMILLMLPAWIFRHSQLKL